MEKRTGRIRTTIHEHLDESRDVPKLKPGIHTRQVASDTGGRVGIARSTIACAGDGGYALRALKETENLCEYKGKLLKTREEIDKATLTSVYVLEYGGIAIDA